MSDQELDTEIQTENTNFLYKEGGKLHELPSMCMYCHQEGVTKMLLTKIPLFKEIIVSSFECPHCHYKETDVKSASGIAETTIRYELTFDVLEMDDDEIRQNLNRQVVRSETAAIIIPELDFEIEAKRSEIITIEGMLRNIRESLTAGQEERKTVQPEAYEKLQAFIERIQMMEEGRDSFTFVIDDKGGNSFLQNPHAPSPDRNCVVSRRYRTAEENVELGYLASEGIVADTSDDSERPLTEEEKDEVIRRTLEEISLRDESIKRVNTMKQLSSLDHKDNTDLYDAEGRGDGYKSGGSKAALNIMSATLMGKKPMDRFEAIRENRELQTAMFRERCHQCSRTNETRMLLFDIPYFNTIIIMCTDCAYCGYKHSEIKPGNGYADQGQKITVSINTVEDLSRDVLKSDHAAIYIPEIDMELSYGTLGGKFTTIEGVISEVREQLDTNRPYYEGDSSSDTTREKYEKFLQAMSDCLAVKTPFTFVLDDPSGSSFIEGRVNGVPDTNPLEDTTMIVENYERTLAHNDLLGISDMKTEGYNIQAEAASALLRTAQAEKEAAVTETEPEVSTQTEESSN